MLRRSRYAKLWILMPSVFLGLGFGGVSLNPTNPSLDHTTPPSDELLAQAKGLFAPLPDSPTSPSSNPTTEEKADLGKSLYHDPRLSKSQAISCASCHNLALGGADARSVSIGHMGQVGTRNANTTLNADFQLAQFWDGRAKDLEEQALGPLVNPVEMANDSLKDVLTLLKSIPGYEEAFKKAFPEESDPITEATLSKAIAAYERTLLTPSRFDTFLKGDPQALSSEEREGLKLFMAKGCAGCHNGVGLGGGEFEKVGLFAPYDNQEDLGRFEVTKNPEDRYVFKVPVLRNIVETYPYFHDGAVWTLKEAIQTMGRLQLGTELSPEETQKIEAFLGSLSGMVPLEARTLPVLPPAGPDTPRPRN